jgi:hypothetical protein
MAPDGLITIESPYGPEETMNRFEVAATESSDLSDRSPDDAEQIPRRLFPYRITREPCGECGIALK